jgi:hypothetical protein
MKIEKDFKNKLTKKDYITYLINRNMILLLSPVIIVALLVAIIYSIITEGFGFFTIIYMLPIALFVLSYIQMYRVINHTLKSQKQINELKITLTDNEYKDLTNGELNALPYDKAYCYKETKNHLYIFVDRYNALILPKREFNEQELNQIETTFSKKIRKEPLYNFSSWFLVLILIALVTLIIYKMVTGQ